MLSWNIIHQCKDYKNYNSHLKLCVFPPSSIQAHYGFKITSTWNLSWNGNYTLTPCPWYELTNKTIFKFNTVLRKHGFKGDDMKHFVHCIICANNANVSDDTRLEMQVLPGATEVSSMLDHTNPVLLIHWDFYVIWVRSETRKKSV
jgi:hypothetical protein